MRDKALDQVDELGPLLVELRQRDFGNVQIQLQFRILAQSKNGLLINGHGFKWWTRETQASEFSVLPFLTMWASSSERRSMLVKGNTNCLSGSHCSNCYKAACCWKGLCDFEPLLGTVQTFQFTSKNKRMLETSGVPIRELPATFQDATKVIRFLRIRYLWIDSLCIVQDSTADCKAESSIMDKVYQHGRINITTTPSLNLNNRLFFDRDPVLVRPFPVYCHKVLHWCISSRLAYTDLAAEPLNRRGWVFQERLLSQRFTLPS
ncbi:hypothetical protein QBC36DRAFT_316267 [Triangularia setosa]|uniref:Heterokaryon incompatibility domain-containing protein n=1 Tax=Triangularia setosa TaxID=2587417 RepID=A0AAN6VW69_9PEZI|nr:hypothetical protein QBC36DRAFT_316267 [Podospora setosa]